MNILEKARPENSFRCADGSVISSVYELENRLCAMSSEAFHHHANPYRNDFHNWIRDVFQDYELANELLSAKTPTQAAATVRKHLRKALLAKEEIEDAIKTVSTAKTRPVKDAVNAKPAKAAPKRLKKPQLKPRSQRKKAGLVTKKKARGTAAVIKTATAKNRKLNKKHNKKKLNRVAAKKRKIRNSRSHYKRGKSARKRAKKQVNRWLNWLKIVPEL